MISPDRKSPNFILDVQEVYPRITIIHHVDQDGNLWGTSGRKIMIHRPGGIWQEFNKFPFAAPRDFFTFSRPSTRAMRADKCNVFANSSGGLLGIRATQVYALTDANPPRPLFRINGDSVLHGSITEGPSGWTYLGEYFMNPERIPVRIWRLSPDLNTWEIAHQFPPGSVRHVHGIYRDPFDHDALWITCGDFTDECHIYRTRDRFETLEKFGDGSQIWRAVRLFFTPEHIGWLTDSNIEQNYACRMRRGDSQLEIGQRLNASVWYGSETKEGAYIAFTTIEPGPGIHTDSSAVLISDDGFRWEPIYSLKKDFWRPMQLFKYGVISCPSGPASLESFYMSGEGLEYLDGISMRVKITRADT